MRGVKGGSQGGSKGGAKGVGSEEMRETIGVVKRNIGLSMVVIRSLKTALGMGLGPKTLFKES